MNKAELRSRLKHLRQNIPETERLTLSQQICRRLEGLDWADIHLLHCYEPIAQLKEVDITAFIATIQRQYPKIQLYTSRRIDNVWEVVAWQNHEITPTPQFDAVIVPMLGFDSRLHRIGYGGGYYDRFLATQPQARKIGVCFKLGRVQHVPAEPHDVVLDTIVTESAV
jgi:5-formyltetrahydrofolate cyclo-ligase